MPAFSGKVSTSWLVSTMSTMATPWWILSGVLLQLPLPVRPIGHYLLIMLFGGTIRWVSPEMERHFIEKGRGRKHKC